MNNRQGDRHKTPRHYQAGSDKRKNAKEKQKRESEVLSQTRRLTDFVTKRPTASTSSHNPDEIIIAGHDAAVSDPAILDESVKRDHSNIDDVVNDTISGEVNTLETEDEKFSDCDIGLWPENMEDHLSYWFKLGSKRVQNCDAELLKHKSFKQYDNSFTRTCQMSMFERKHKNGETIKREWLCFSPSNGKLYCFFCKLLNTAQTQFSHGGCCDWKNANDRLVKHETSSAHLKATIAFQTRSQESGRIDFELTQQLDEEMKYWRNVLKRVASVILFVSERGLPLRGNNEIIGSAHNGNYLGLLKLLAEYDDFLKGHIENHANCGRGHVNYLSSTICNEFRQLIAQRVFDEIIRRIKHSQYYSFTLDSTKDEGHIDQLVLVFRYIEENGDPVERFLTFMPNQGHKAKDMFDGLMNFLNENHLQIKNCRGQSYDNASAMSGKFAGLQALVRGVNDLACWVPCFGHSLNLVGTDTMNSCPNAKFFFSFLEQIYVFFTSSTDRYSALVRCLRSACTPENPVLVPKRVSTTRWSSRADAAKCLVRGYAQIKSTLSEMVEENSEARGLHDQICKLEIGIFAIFWNEILDRVNHTSKCLQSAAIDLNTSIEMLKSLKSFIEIKKHSFSEYERQGADLCGNKQYAIENKRKCTRNVRLNPLDYAHTPEVELTASETFRVQSFLPVIDQFIMSLTKRISAYTEIHSRFGFLREINDLTPEEINYRAKSLVDVYKNDLDENLGIELIHYREFCNDFSEEKEKGMSQEHFMLKLLVDKQVKDSFPNVEIMLKIYLCIMTSNCSGERSFSKLKLIKNRLSTTMTQENLIDRTILSTEYDLMKVLDISDIIDDFAKKKARKIPL